MKWFIDDNSQYLCVAFRDKKAKKFVAVVTSSGSFETTTVRARRGEVIKPKCIDKYNRKMNGCDRADQMVGYYGVHRRKSNKWWKKSLRFPHRTHSFKFKDYIFSCTHDNSSSGAWQSTSKASASCGKLQKFLIEIH